MLPDKSRKLLANAPLPSRTAVGFHFLIISSILYTSRTISSQIAPPLSMNSGILETYGTAERALA